VETKTSQSWRLVEESLIQQLGLNNPCIHLFPLMESQGRCTTVSGKCI
jgi:hypothetical protein